MAAPLASRRHRVTLGQRVGPGADHAALSRSRRAARTLSNTQHYAGEHQVNRLLVGALIGAIPFPLFGVRITFSAAAVLMTGIVFGWLKTRHPAFGGPISEGARSLMEEMGLNVFTSALAINSGLVVYQVATSGLIWELLLASKVISLLPELIAWWGRTSLAALERGAFDGRHRGCAPEYDVDAHCAERIAIGRAGYRLPRAARHRHDRAVRGKLFLRVVL
ncbi:MAG TPA: hypothetical protein VFS76_25535 [Pyrinomonadaceae bacterium]|nr:hypothetical protein [Pyrinomonadaceae bacterium]